jgi:hypothetical protein
MYILDMNILDMKQFIFESEFRHGLFLARVHDECQWTGQKHRSEWSVPRNEYLSIQKLSHSFLSLIVDMALFLHANV